MDEEHILGKDFEFDNVYGKSPRKLGFAELVQLGELCCESNYVIAPHVQTCAEISYIVSGEGCFGAGGETYRVRQGDLFLNLKGEVHSIRASGRENLWFLYVAFNCDRASAGRAMEPVVDFFSGPVRQRLQRDVLNVKDPFRKILEETYSGAPLAEEMIGGYLKQIFILTYRTYAKTDSLKYVPPRSENEVGSTVYRVIRHVDANILEIRSVGGIADSLGYSSAYLSHLFRDKTGITLQNYVNYKKIEKSLELIDGGRFSMTQIARMLNFESVQSFSRAFKRTFGISPSLYRKTGGAEL